MEDSGRYSVANTGGSTEHVNGSNFTEIDSLNCAELSYMVPSERPDWFYDGMSLSEYCNIMASTETNAEKSALLTSMANNPRYENCTISGCENVNTDTEQWGQITVELNDSQNTAVIAYQGTDGTPTGWDEDWLLAYSNGTEAQLHSQAYLNQYAEAHPDANIILTGHSKGGNDAIYAYTASDESVRNQVSHIYNFDGPGVGFDQDTNPGYAQAIAELDNGKLDNYYPQDSIIGQMLQTHGTSHFVYSDGNSSQSDFPVLSEHDAFTWYVNGDGTGFVETEQSPLSRYVNNVFDDTLSGMSYYDRRQVVELLTRTGVSGLLTGDTSAAEVGINFALIMLTDGIAYMPSVMTFLGTIVFYGQLERIAVIPRYIAESLQEYYNNAREIIGEIVRSAIEILPESWRDRLDAFGEWAVGHIEELGYGFDRFISRIIGENPSLGGIPSIAIGSADFKVETSVLTEAQSQLRDIAAKVMEISGQVAMCALNVNVLSFASAGTINLSIAAQSAASLKYGLKLYTFANKAGQIGGLYQRAERQLMTPQAG